MKIRKNSWHYWLYELGHSRLFVPESTNLCSYFWRVVWGAVTIAFAAGVVIGIVGGIGVLFYNHTFVAFTILGGLVSGGLLIWLCYYIREKLDDRQWDNRHQKPEPGLLRSYLKARKNKVCPIVTFGDTE